MLFSSFIVNDKLVRQQKYVRCAPETLKGAGLKLEASHIFVKGLDTCWHKMLQRIIPG